MMCPGCGMLDGEHKSSCLGRPPYRSAILDAVRAVKEATKGMGSKPEAIFFERVDPWRGASVQTLRRRVEYGGRKGRRARRRLTAIVEDARRAFGGEARARLVHRYPWLLHRVEWS